MAKISDEEKFVNALNKLLANYGVDDEELRTEFITDFKNEVDSAVDGEEEIDTEKEVDETKEQEPVETETDENETVDEVEPTENKQEPEIEPVENGEVDGTVEQEPEIDYKKVYEEQKNTIEGLAARIETLENIVSKLGVPEKDETFGASPVAENQPSDTNNAFDRYVNARKGQ